MGGRRDTFSGGGIFFSGGGKYFSGGGIILLVRENSTASPPLYETLNFIYNIYYLFLLARQKIKQLAIINS